MTQDENPIGIKQQIRAAQSVAEVQGLLTQGGRFKNAASHTRNQWQREARRKIAQLRQPDWSPSK